MGHRHCMRCGWKRRSCRLIAKCRWQKCNHKIRGTWIYNRSANRELSFRWPLADNDNVLLSSAMIASDLELGLGLALGLVLDRVKGSRMPYQDKLAALLVVGGIYELKVPPLWWGHWRWETTTAFIVTTRRRSQSTRIHSVPVRREKQLQQKRQQRLQKWKR